MLYWCTCIAPFLISYMFYCYSGIRHDSSLALPIRQTASIFKQPVTLVRNRPESQTKNDLKHGPQDPPKQVNITTNYCAEYYEVWKADRLSCLHLTEIRKDYHWILTKSNKLIAMNNKCRCSELKNWSVNYSPDQ